MDFLLRSLALVSLTLSLYILYTLLYILSTLESSLAQALSSKHRATCVGIGITVAVCGRLAWRRTAGAEARASRKKTTSSLSNPHYGLVVFVEPGALYRPYGAMCDVLCIVPPNHRVCPLQTGGAVTRLVSRSPYKVMFNGLHETSTHRNFPGANVVTSNKMRVLEGANAVPAKSIAPPSSP